MADDKPTIPAADVYRALPPGLARDLHDFCRIAKEHPANVIADALTLHLDELGGRFDPGALEPTRSGAEAQA